MKARNFINIKPILISDIDINKIIISNKFPFGKEDFKYIISYNNSVKFRPLCVFFPKSLYIKDILMQTDVFIF